MNGCTIHYQYDDKDISSVTSGKIVDVINNSYLVHTPYNNLDKSIKFNSETMNGSSYNKYDNVKQLNIKGYRVWESPYEINIEFKKFDSGNSDYTYDVFMYGVVYIGYLNLKGITDININKSSVKIAFMKNNVEVESPINIETNISKNNYLGEDGKIINIGLKNPVRQISINRNPYSDRIYSDLMPES